MESMDGEPGVGGKHSIDDVMDMIGVLDAWRAAENRAQRRANKPKKSDDDDDDE